MTPPTPIDEKAVERAEKLAQQFHETYERLAPSFGYETREASAKPWADVPDQNKRLMIAVCGEILALTRSAPAGEGEVERASKAVNDLCELHRKMLNAVEAQRPYPVSIAVGNSDLDTVLSAAVELERAKVALTPKVAPDAIATQERAAIERGFDAAVQAIRSWAEGFLSEATQKHAHAFANDLERNKSTILDHLTPAAEDGR